MPQMTHLSIKFERRRIKWPAANKASLWNQLHKDVDQILDVTAGGDADRKLPAMRAVTVSQSQSQSQRARGPEGLTQSK